MGGGGGGLGHDWAQPADGGEEALRQLSRGGAGVLFQVEFRGADPGVLKARLLFGLVPPGEVATRDKLHRRLVALHGDHLKQAVLTSGPAGSQRLVS